MQSYQGNTFKCRFLIRAGGVRRLTDSRSRPAHLARSDASQEQGHVRLSRLHKQISAQDTMMLLMGMWTSLTTNPMKPIIANPTAVANAVRWNSADKIENALTKASTANGREESGMKVSKISLLGAFVWTYRKKRRMVREAHPERKVTYLYGRVSCIG